MTVHDALQQMVAWMVWAACPEKLVMADDGVVVVAAVGKMATVESPRQQLGLEATPAGVEEAQAKDNRQEGGAQDAQ